MSATYPNASGQSVYHSDLRTVGRHKVRFKTEIQRSKREGGGYYISFEAADDPTLYHYTIESPECSGALTTLGLPSQWVWVTASGRKDTALLEFEQLEPDEIPAEPFSYPTVESAANAALVAAMRAADFAANIVGRDPTPADHTFAVSLMIRQERLGVPIVGGDIKPDLDPDEESGTHTSHKVTGTGEVLASQSELKELVGLAHETSTTEEQEKLATWIDTGEITRIQYVRMREQLRSRPEGS